MAFDVEGARKAGYSDTEIADHLAAERKFDAAAARKSGYSDAEILGHLREPMAPATPPEPAPNTLGSLARGAVQGATFGFADELRAGTDAAVQGAKNLFTSGGPTMGETYDQSLASSRADNQRDMAHNPAATLAGNVAGGLAVPLPGASAINGFRGAAAVRGGVAGVTGGALSGFGEGQGGFGERMGSAATGGALGAAGGAAIGLGANAVAGVGGRAMHALGLRNPEVAADRQILRALERDGLNPSIFGRPQAGPAMPEAPFALADQGGRNVTNLAAVAANTPGHAMELADQLVQGRRLARPERIAGAVDDAFGGGGGTRVADEVAALSQKRSTEAAPLYRDAFDQTTPLNDGLEILTKDPIGRKGLARGLEIQRIELAAEGKAPDKMLGMDPAVHYDDAGEPFIKGEPSTRTLDSIKRGIDGMLEEYRDKTSGKVHLDERGRAIQQFRNTLMGHLDAGNPAYAEARAAWGGPTQSMDAMQRGTKALGMNRDVVASITSRLSPTDMDFFRLGVGRAVTDATSDPARASGFARKLLEDEQMKARLQSAIPDPAQRAQFRAAMENEVKMTKTERALTGGSQTHRLGAAADDMKDDPAGGFLMSLLDAGTRGGLGGMASRAAMSGYRRVQGINPATSDALASRLFSTDPTQNAATVQALLARQQGDKLSDKAQRELMARLLQASGGAAGLGAN